MSLVQTTFCKSPLLTQVSGLVCDENNNLYACNFGSPTASIIKINPQGKATLLTEQYSGDRNFVTMVYLEDFLYVTGFNNCVYKVNIHTGELITFVTLPDNGTNGITYYKNKFYVVTQDCMNSGSVYKVELDGSFSVLIDKTGLIGTQYNTITVDEKGNLYITDKGNNSVVKYDKHGHIINSNFITGPYQSILIHDRFIYVTNYIINQISQYNMYGNIITEKFAEGGLTFAGGGVAFDKYGNFYCSKEPEGGPGNGDVTVQKVLNNNNDNSDNDSDM